MKVLFYASNPDDHRSLRLEHDITEFQRVAADPTGRRVEFIFLPALPFEDLEEQIAIHKPDIVHISAHGESEALVLTSAGKYTVRLSSDSLRALLFSAPPKLVYINACNSESIAKEIVDVVPFAMGTTADISNIAARKSAVAFYRNAIRGATLADAERVSNAIAQTLSNCGVKTVLHWRPTLDPRAAVLFQPLRIIANFEDHEFKMDEVSGCSINIGLSGCPPSTVQLVICTDDESFINFDDDEEDEDEEGENEDEDEDGELAENSLEYKLCSVVRGYPVRGELWLDESWENIGGDFRIFAFGITAEGASFSCATQLCDALERFYRVYFETSDSSAFPPDLKHALHVLQQSDGTELRPKGMAQYPKGSPRIGEGDNRGKRKTKTKAAGAGE